MNDATRQLYFERFLPIVAAVIAIIITATFFWNMASSRTEQFHRAQRDAIENQLLDHRYQLEQGLEKTRQLGYDLATMLKFSPNISADNFNKLAQQLTYNRPAILFLALHDDETTTIYPRALSEHVQQSGQLGKAPSELGANEGAAVSTPYPLRNGLSAVNIHYPTSQANQYLTLSLEVLALLDYQSPRRSGDLRLAMKHSGHEALLLGQREILTMDPVKVELEFKGATWTLAGVPEGGWPPQVANWPWVILLASVGVAIVTFVFFFNMVQLQKANRRTKSELRKRHMALREARRMRKALDTYTKRPHEAQSLEESEQGYRKLLESLSDGVCIIQFGRLCYTNPSLCEISGYHNQELIGSEFYTYLHPNDRERITSYYEERMRGNNAPSEYDARIICRDGTEKTVRINSSIIEWSGQPAILVTICDMTHRYRIEDSIKELNATLEQRVQQEVQRRMESDVFLQTIFDNSSFGIVLLGDNGNIVQANKAFCTLLGYTMDDLRKHSLQSLLSEENRDTVTQAFYELISGKRDISLLEVSAKSLEQQFISMQITATSLRDQNREIKGVFAIIKDITDIKKMTDRQQCQEQLLIQQSKMATMGEMIGAITHQWRQPLTMLELTLQEIAEEHKEGQLTRAMIDDMAHRCRQHIDFMSRTIEDFSNFFRPDKHQVSFNPLEAIKDIERLLYKQLTRHNVRLEYDIGEIDTDCFHITTIANEFKQIVLNIIVNAIDAIDEARYSGALEQSESGVIKVTIGNTDASYKFSFCDNGVGIPQGNLEQVFEPYFTTKPGHKGTGIGLYLSRVIVENSLGGNITASNSSSGACFELELPAFNLTSKSVAGSE